MSIQLILYPVIIVLAILLMAAILLQRRGTGLGSAFGGEGNVFASRRGVEKILFLASVGLSLFLLIAALASLVLKV